MFSSKDISVSLEEMYPIKSIVAAALGVEVVMLAILYIGNIGGKNIRRWYSELGASAFLMDVLSLIFAVWLASYFAKTLPYQIGMVILIQLLHDVPMGYLVNTVKRGGPLLDLWKDYAKEMGVKILVVDAILLVSTLVVAYVIENYIKIKDEILYFLIATFSYVSLFLVHSF